MVEAGFKPRAVAEPPGAERVLGVGGGTWQGSCPPGRWECPGMAALLHSVALPSAPQESAALIQACISLATMAVLP